MQFLKTVVIVLAVLIVMCLGLLGYGFYKKSTEPGWTLFAGSDAPAPEMPPAVQLLRPKPGPARDFGDVKLDLPAGCMITDVKAKRRRVFLMIGPGEECNRVVVFDLREGRVLGTLSPGP